MDNELVAGPQPGRFRLTFIRRDTRWEVAWRLMEVTEDLDDDGERIRVPIAWPAAPDLYVGEDLAIGATLEPDEQTNTEDSVAVWTISAEQKGALIDMIPASIAVEGETWWLGEVTCLA